jgi:hypothetical protein
VTASEIKAKPLAPSTSAKKRTKGERGVMSP